MEIERSEKLFLARVVREGFVEPLIFELVLELGRIWTGGLWGGGGCGDPLIGAEFILKAQTQKV